MSSTANMMLSRTLVTAGLRFVTDCHVDALARLCAGSPLVMARAALAAPEGPPPRASTFSDAGYGSLGVNRPVTLSHPVLGAFDLVCPQTPHPNPFIVIVLDPSQPRGDGQGIATALARHGFGAIVLEPAHASADR